MSSHQSHVNVLQHDFMLYLQFHDFMLFLYLLKLNSKNLNVWFWFWIFSFSFGFVFFCIYFIYLQFLPSDIHRFKNCGVQLNDECVICLEKFYPNTMVVKLSVCNCQFAYHRECFKFWPKCTACGRSNDTIKNIYHSDELQLVLIYFAILQLLLLDAKLEEYNRNILYWY